jgi:hypothetical protein
VAHVANQFLQRRGTEAGTHANGSQQEAKPSGARVEVAGGQVH